MSETSPTARALRALDLLQGRPGITAAELAQRLGVTFAEPAVDWPGIRDRIFGRIDPISAGGEAYRLSQEHTTLYRAHATFSGERRRLRAANQLEIEA